MNRSKGNLSNGVLKVDDKESRLDLDKVDEDGARDILQHLKLTVNDLDSATSLQRTNDVLARALVDLHEETNDLLRRLGLS